MPDNEEYLVERNDLLWFIEQLNKMLNDQHEISHTDLNTAFARYWSTEDAAGKTTFTLHVEVEEWR